MKFYIREWSEGTIVLMTDAGHVLSYFSTVRDALHACSEWYGANGKEKKYEVTVQYKNQGNAYATVARCA